jgi:RalA-binding protein 1
VEDAILCTPEFRAGILRKCELYITFIHLSNNVSQRGGAHLGSINITGAQIGRQQRQASPDDENAYRHAFLIIEQPKKGAAPARHVLCAASDAERDDWVDVLVRSVALAYPSSASSVSGSSDAGYSYGEQSYPPSDSTLNPSRPSTSSSIPSDQGPPGSSPVERIGGQGYSDAQLAQRIIERNGYGSQGGASPGSVALSSSLPSNLDNNTAASYNQTRSNSSLGHYTDSKDPRVASQYPDSRSNPSQMHEQMVAPRKDKAGRTSYHPSLGMKNNPNDRGDDSSAGESTTAGSVLGTGVKKISGPLNAQPIPPGAKFGNKDALAPDSSPIGEKDRKTKSTRFWPTFGKGTFRSGVEMRWILMEMLNHP